jgi:hypothetical protein
MNAKQGGRDQGDRKGMLAIGPIPPGTRRR